MPGPLPCAIGLAIVLAIVAPGHDRAIPAGTTPDDRHSDRLVGVVGGPVLATPRGLGAPLHVRITADVETTVWLWSERAVEPGQLVRVTGRLRTPRGFAAPGSPDRADTLASRGASWELSTSSVEVLADQPDTIDQAWRWARAVQRELVAQIGHGEPDASARAALRGIVTGDRVGIPPELDARWRAVGIYHVLSVSGLHLAVIAGLAFALLRRLIAASPLGTCTRPARWAAPLALGLALAYTLITGAQLATVRALIVVAIVLGAQMLDRPVRLLDALGAAAIAILVWRPQDLHDPSFQLSFVAALALALAPAARPLGNANRFVHWLRRGLATSAWVALATAPITALHFQQVAIGGLVGNLVLTPIVELLALPLGLAGALLGHAGLDGAGGVVVEVAVFLVARVDDIAGAVAHAMPVGALAIESRLAVAVLVVATLVLCARRGHRNRIDVVLIVIIGCLWAAAPHRAHPGQLRISFLDVGQGDAALVELPTGEVWLVDAGGHASSPDLRRASKPGTAIERALAVYGHDAIDLAIVSHPHPDHYMGLGGLTVPVRELWFVDPDHTGSFAAVVGELVARGTRIGKPALGDITRGGVTLSVLAVGGDPVRSVNDNSLVVAVTYAGRTVLFTGDLEAEGEAAVVAAGLPPVDVVKVAHHGSRTSSSEALVQATRPAHAVISCGLGNAFGFPAGEVVERWRAVGARVSRTDLDGTVTVTVGATGDVDVSHYRP